MRTAIFAVLALASCPAVLAQEDPGPSPTESVGCEPHGDHWHCAGPAPTITPDVTTVVTPLVPSPTESVGCEPHGDHWHCDGPRVTSTDDGHSHTASPAIPSPTESVGCEPHGDHWHCDGPASATASATSSSASSSASASPSEPVEFEGDATSLRSGIVMAVTLAAMAAAVCYL
ncbi:hypothetical protein M432DRAFT_12791 [Thermoascus aurantiacus ATCC 26904]